MGIQATVERVSFAGGELGKNARARADLAKYQIALAVMENYITMVEGGATRAPGTRMVLELKNEAQTGRLVPFRLAQDDYYMLVLNGLKSRFVRAGGFLQNPDTTPYEIDVPYSEADLAKLRYATTGNTIYTADGARFGKLIRTGLIEWSYQDVIPDGGPVDTQNLDTAITVQASAITGNINLVGVGNPFTAAMVGQVMRLDESDLSLVAEWVPDEAGIAANAQRRWNGNVYQALNGGNAGPNAPTHIEGDVSAGTGFVTWRFLHPGYGYVKLTAFTDVNTAAGTVLSRLPDSTVTKPTYRWSPPAWSSDLGFPTALAFSSPRLVILRTDTVWLSAIDNPENLKVTGKDTDAISVRLRSPDGSLVDGEWAMFAGALIVGSSDLEWVFRAGTSLFDALTPENINPIPDSDEGSVPQIPVRVDGGVMFVGKSGKRLHYGKIDPQGQGAQRFDPDEISVTARHIFAPGVKAAAWQRDPHRILWMVMQDGTLAALTFMPKQQVVAFHRHPRVNAIFEDVAVIPSTAGGRDEVYFIVQRQINGQTRRFVEQLADFFEPQDPDSPTAEGAWLLDCALQYSGPKVSQITNLAHLEGQEVGVFASGLMQGRKIVAGGAINLDRASGDVLVGLPIRAELTDLPRNLQTQAGPTTGKEKTIAQGIFYFKESAGGVVTCNGGPEEPITEGGNKAYGKPMPLFSGEKRIPIEGEYGTEAALSVVNDDAMPCTVLAMSPELDIEET